MYQQNQLVTIATAPAAYLLATGLTGRINSVTTDPVSGSTVYSVITTEPAGTQPYVGGRGGDLYECHGLGESDLRPVESADLYLSEVEPAPGWEDRAVERARDAGLFDRR